MTDAINLFWRQTRNPLLREKEKENNVTHALLILLSKNHEALNLLSNKLGFNEINKNNKEVVFQVTSKNNIRTKECKNKFILFIKSKYNEAESLIEEDKKQDIPDGLIMDDKTAILIEAKVSAPKDHYQISRYNRSYFNNSAKEIHTTWEYIYSTISKIKDTKDKNSLSNFLLNEFKNYLGVIHLDGFSGIKFFDSKESYNSVDASYILKHLMIELKEKQWFKELLYITGDRPKAGAWDYWYHKDIKRSINPRGFPHYSIYIFDEFFAIDCLFHKSELKKILKDQNLFDKFLIMIKKLANDSPDYYFSAVHYRLFYNKEKARARQGDAYHDLEFIFQLKRFIQNHKNDFEKHLRNYLELLINDPIKQFSIIKKAHYKDKDYKSFVEPLPCLKFINSTLSETKKLYKFIINLNKP